MYSAMLTLHSWLRWLVLILGVVAIARAASASRARQWTRGDDRATLWFTIALDLQLLLGVLLYFALSPITKSALQNMGGAMKIATVRYWAVEHPFGMAAALVLAHVGRARLRRLPDERRGRTALVFIVLALVVIAATLPWPGRPYGRPLFRW